MSPPDTRLVEDILGAVAGIDEIVAQGRESYDGSDILRRAAERYLEIIGKAARLLSAEFQERYPDLEISGAIGQRNFIAHEYWKVDYGDLWLTMTVDVPRFAAALRTARGSQSA